VKIGYWGEAILKVTPEYEECRRQAPNTMWRSAASIRRPPPKSNGAISLQAGSK